MKESKTWIDLVREYKPETTNDEADFILWEKTAFPFATEEYVRKQLDDYFKKVVN